MLLALAGAAVGLRAVLGASRGLSAEYFAGDQWDAPRAIQLVTPEISTARIAADWGGPPPPTFRARWFGYLTVPRAGDYTFALTSDDGSTLQIDGQLVVDNGGTHTAATQTGRIRLERGPHFVLLEYVQAGGAYEMGWAWTRDGPQLEGVSRWVLSPRRLPYWQVPLPLILGWLAAAALVSFGLIGSWQVYRRAGPIVQAARLHPRAASLALFVALAVFHTWPLATDPAHLSRNDNGDTLLNEWAISWFAHQALRAPLELFDANIFYPERDTLAYSEALIVQGAMGAPLRWLGASPVLTYNLVLLAGFILTAWAMCLVVARWTGDWAAGLAAGMLFGFNSHTLTRLPHLQAQHVEFLPLALLALDAVIREPGVRPAARLAGWFALQALTSVYLLVISAFALAAASLARPEWYTSRRLLKVAPYIALAAGLACIVLLPYLLPYWRLSRDPLFSRSIEQSIQYSASWADYLATPGRLHYAWWSHRWFAGTALFPGMVGLLLTATAIGFGVAFKDRRARMCLAFGVCGVALSFGTQLPGYATLYRFIPLLHAIRAPDRFGYLAIVATSVLAAFGLVEIRRRVPTRVWTPLLAVVLGLITLEATAAPLGFTRYDGIPRIYRELRNEPHAVVVEVPLHAPRAAFLNARFMLNSTEHWKPLVNGYSGFVPDSYRRNYERLVRFQDARSIEALEGLGVTHVFVHLDEFRPHIPAEIERVPTLHQLATEGSIALYRLGVP